MDIKLKWYHTVWLIVIICLVFSSIGLAQTPKTTTLTWTANTETDLAGYKVYRGNASCAAATAMIPVATLGKVVTYADSTIPSTWFIVAYWLTAVDTSNNESLKSNCVEKTFYVNPVAPTMVAGATTLTSITVSWNGVDDGSGFPAKYILKYAVAPVLTNGGWTTATTATCASLTAVTCTVPGLTAGTQYEFQVMAYRTSATGNVTSPPSTVLRVNTVAPDVTPPAAPQGLVVASIEGLTAHLEWQPVAQAVDYEIRRLDTSTKKWVPFVPPIVSTTNKTTAPVASVGMRRYQVCARNSAGTVCQATAGVWTVRG